jgi:hypothetical protein
MVSTIMDSHTAYKRTVRVYGRHTTYQFTPRTWVLAAKVRAGGCRNR